MKFIVAVLVTIFIGYSATISADVLDSFATSFNRDELIRRGLACRVCCKGEQEYISATYTAYSVLKAITRNAAGAAL